MQEKIVFRSKSGVWESQGERGERDGKSKKAARFQKVSNVYTRRGCVLWEEIPWNSLQEQLEPFFFFPIQLIFIFFFSFIFISWRLITPQYCSGFCHTLTWISHGFTYIPHPDPPYHLPPHPIPLGIPSAPGPSTCLMHPTRAGDLFHPR